MMFPQIRCYHSSQCNQQFIFYILCKGENAGKPSLKPWANSFVVVCSNQQCFDFYFWLVYGLFKTSKFKIRLRGSVIPFINLQDVRDTLKEVAPSVLPDWSKFQELITTLDNIDKLKTNLSQQIIHTEHLQQALIQKYFNEIK